MANKKKRIFVTGATGFIGSNFLSKLAASKQDVVALRRKDDSKSRIPLESEPEWVTGSIDNIDGHRLEGVDCLVHLAAHGNHPPYDSLESCMYWNVQAPIQLIRLAHRFGVKQVVATGSCFEYGLTGNHVEFLKVNDPLMPVGSYATSKAIATFAFREITRELGLHFTLYRPFHVYGEGESEERLWPSLRRAAMSGKDFPMTLGEQIRDFTPIDLVVSSLMKSCLSSEPIHGQFEIENIGTGQAQSVLEFSRYWWSRWDAIGELKVGAIPYRDNEIMRYVPSIN